MGRLLAKVGYGAIATVSPGRRRYRTAQRHHTLVHIRMWHLLLKPIRRPYKRLLATNRLTHHPLVRRRAEKPSLSRFRKLLLIV